LTAICLLCISNCLPRGFPQHGTENQFFTSEQFRDYFELGQRNCGALLNQLDQAILNVNNPLVDADIGYLFYVKMKV